MTSVGSSSSSGSASNQKKLPSASSARFHRTMPTKLLLTAWKGLRIPRFTKSHSGSPFQWPYLPQSMHLPVFLELEFVATCA